MLDPEKIKEYIKDKPELNILYDNMEQFSEELMDVIIPMTYQEVQVLAPAIAEPKEQLPDVIMLHGVLARLLESESFLELRNQLQYQDNNMQSMPLSNKHGEYTQLSQLMRQYFQQLLSAFATAKFYQTAWGSSWSNSVEMDYMWGGYFDVNLYQDLLP
jgi:hypothetical protein